MILHARSSMAVAARAAGVQAIDTPFFGLVIDLEGLAEEAQKVKLLGFSGKQLTHPRHVAAVNEAFSPAKDDVEWCEENPKKAYNVNVQGVVNITDHFDGIFIYLSSVHVFSGKRYFAYSEKHKPEPVNCYGYTKWGGELATEVSSFLCKRAITVRTSKLFNYSSLEPNISHVKRDHEIEATAIVKRSFLYLPHFVAGLLHVVNWANQMPDLVHIAGTETISYWQFWNEIAQRFDGYEHLVKPMRSWVKREENRPRRGGLSVKLAESLGIPTYSAYDGIKEMLK